MQINLKGQNILVTGASRGIGRAIALQLAEAGANVAAQYHHNHNKARSLAKENSRIKTYSCDLSEAMKVVELFNAILHDFKSINGVVNNAAVAVQSDPAGNDVEWVDDWMTTIDVNLNAVALLCKKSIEHFVNHDGGRVINIASRAAFRGDTKDYLAYAASKGGVVSLTKSIARAYGKSGVKAFVIAPGFVETDMAQPFKDKYGDEFLKEGLALNHITQPEDIAPLVAFLMSGMADHSTGATFDVNAGSYMR